MKDLLASGSHQSSQKSMRILHVAFQREQHRAGQQLVANFARWSRRAGLACDWALVDTTGGMGKPLAAEEQPRLRFVWKQRFNALQLWQVARAIRRSAYDIVHFHAWGGREYLLKRLLGGHAQIVTHSHGIPGQAVAHPRKARQWVGRIIEGSDLVVANSLFTANWLRSVARSEVPLRVVYNGIDLDAFRPTESAESIRRSWGASPATIVVGMVARLIPEKALPEALVAVTPLLRSSDRYRVVILGDGPEAPKLKRLIRDSQLGNSVHLLGWRRDVPNCLQGMDLLLHSSHCEGFGMAVLEAMAMSKPVVAYAVGGIPELVSPGENGYLVPPGAIPELRHAVAQLASNGELRQKMGQAGRRIAQERFSATRMGCELRALYESTVCAAKSIP